VPQKEAGARVAINPLLISALKMASIRLEALAADAGSGGPDQELGEVALALFPAFVVPMTSIRVDPTDDASPIGLNTYGSLDYCVGRIRADNVRTSAHPFLHLCRRSFADTLRSGGPPIKPGAACLALIEAKFPVKINTQAAVAQVQAQLLAMRLLSCVRSMMLDVICLRPEHSQRTTFSAVLTDGETWTVYLAGVENNRHAIYESPIFNAQLHAGEIVSILAELVSRRSPSRLDFTLTVHRCWRR
jgi:hypothetical protein